MIAVSEALTGQLYLVSAVALLVGNIGRTIVRGPRRTDVELGAGGRRRPRVRSARETTAGWTADDRASVGDGERPRHPRVVVADLVATDQL